MKIFQYEILFHREIKGQITWFLASDSDNEVGTSLIDVLNKLGAEGWEAVSSGSLGGGSIAEVLLKR